MPDIIITLDEFIETHRDDLDAVIARRLHTSENPRKTDGERRLWILNDEQLYWWAKREGVDGI